MKTYINTHPITVRADHEGIKIIGRTDSMDGSDDFTLDLFNHAEAIMLLTHLRYASDDIQDGDLIGTLLIDGRLVGRPCVTARVVLEWSPEQPSTATAAVIVVADVHGDSRFARLSLSVDAVSTLCVDIEAAVQRVPAESEFHVWEDMPGRAFDPSGGRDWVFEEFAAATATT